MKILQLVKTSEGAHWALNQMHKLVQEGHEVYVAMPLGGKHTKTYDEYGIHTINFDFNLKRLLFSAKKFRKIVYDVNPDIIHSHFYVCMLFMRILLRDNPTPRVFQLPGPSHLFHWITRNVDFLFSQKNDYWAGACQYSCDVYLKHGYSANRVTLAYYQPAIRIENVELFTDKKNLRNELKLSDSAILVGMVSYIYPPKKYLLQRRGIKGHEDFIDAISIVSQINPNIYGVCVGGVWNDDEKYEEQIRRYANKKTDHVFLIGTRHNVPEIYPEFYCVVQPSHEENLGGAAQALTYERPIISSNAGGLTDLVIDGETGYLFPTKNVKKLADAIMKMVSDSEKAKSMTMAGKQRYINLLRDNNGQIERFYDTILSNTI